MTRSTGPGAAHPDGVAEHTVRDHFVANCIADSAGGITFDITAPGRPEGVLVLRPRVRVTAAGSVRPAGELRLPLTGGDGSGLRAVLPGTVELAEGHWDVHAEMPAERPVRPGVRDVRSLVDRVPGAGSVAARVPYATGSGTLAVRSWIRSPHAEAGDVRCAGSTLTVEGMLYGAVLADGAVAEARLRGEDRVRTAAVTGRGGTFAFTLPYAPLAEGFSGEPRCWDLWLCPAGGAAAIRISRILDDVWDKRNVFVYPGHQAGGWRATPCYDSGNDLCVRVDGA